MGSDIPPGSPPSPAKVLFGEEGGAAKTKAPVQATPYQPPQTAVQKAATTPQEAPPEPQEAAPVAEEPVPASQAAVAQADEVLEDDTVSDG